MNPLELFICYATEDGNVAGRVAEALMANKGIKVFFAPWLAPGERWVAAIEEGIRKAEFFVPFLSPVSVQKAWPKLERESAIIRMVNEGLRIIPVNLGVERASVPLLLQTLVWIDATEPDPVKNLVEKISATVYGQAQGPPLGPTPAFVTTPVPNVPDFSLRQADKVTLGILFEIGIGEQLFQFGFEPVEARATEKDIGKDTLDESMEVLKRKNLVSFDRSLFGGAIMTVKLSTRAVEACCRSVVPDYLARKRRVEAAVVGGPDPRMTSSKEVIEATREEPWLVGHVLRYLELRGLLKLKFLNMGYEYEYYSVYSISPELRRALEDPKAVI